MNLRLDWCSHEAALFAVKHWHYSKSLPPPPIVKIGVWEDEKFIGCVLFARGANNNLLKPYGLKVTEGGELVRVALSKHKTPVSRIVAVSLRLLKKANPGLRLIVSYADPNQGHAGGIYQAGGWVYTGKSSSDKAYIDSSGRKWHSRMVASRGYQLVYGKKRSVVKPEDCTVVLLQGKHRYLMPLDAETRKNVLPLSKPYPKRPSSEASSRPSSEGSQRFNSDSRAPTLLQSTAN